MEAKLAGASGRCANGGDIKESCRAEVGWLAIWLQCPKL